MTRRDVPDRYDQFASQKIKSATDRQVFQSAELPDAVLALIARAAVPDEFAQLNDELEHWTP